MIPCRLRDATPANSIPDGEFEPIAVPSATGVGMLQEPGQFGGAVRSDFGIRAMNRQAIRPIDGGVEVSIYVQPKAKRVGIVGEYGQRVKVAVSAAPEGGKANAAVIKLVAAEPGVARRQVELICGTTSRSKDLRVLGLTVAQASECLLP